MNKTRERRIIERFLSAATPDVPWLLEDRERPDFTASHGSRRIGIEHSALHWEARDHPPRQEGEALRGRVVTLAHRRWTEIPRPHIEVSMTFGPGAQLRKADVPHIATAVVSLVELSLPAVGTQRRLKQEHWPDPQWPKGIHAIGISRLVPYRKSHWHANDLDWIPLLAAEYLQERIDDKNADALKYEAHDEQWLVLSMEAGRLSSTFDVPKATWTAEYDAAFDRMFVFENESRSVTELTVRKAARGDR